MSPLEIHPLWLVLAGWLVLLFGGLFFMAAATGGETPTPGDGDE